MRGNEKVRAADCVGQYGNKMYRVATVLTACVAYHPLPKQKHAIRHLPHFH